jgi:hypothetical protein
MGDSGCHRLIGSPVRRTHGSDKGAWPEAHSRRELKFIQRGWLKAGFEQLFGPPRGMYVLKKGEYPAVSVRATDVRARYVFSAAIRQCEKRCFVQSARMDQPEERGFR